MYAVAYASLNIHYLLRQTKLPKQIIAATIKLRETILILVIILNRTKINSKLQSQINTYRIDLKFNTTKMYNTNQFSCTEGCLKLINNKDT